MNIALLGFGTVGKAFYELTLGRSDLRVTERFIPPSAPGASLHRDK